MGIEIKSLGGGWYVDVSEKKFRVSKEELEGSSFEVVEEFSTGDVVDIAPATESDLVPEDVSHAEGELPEFDSEPKPEKKKASKPEKLAKSWGPFEDEEGKPMATFVTTPYGEYWVPINQSLSFEKTDDGSARPVYTGGLADRKPVYRS